MSFLNLAPDAAIGVLMFSHRHNWDGTVCKNASGWNCGSAADFRDMHCAPGKERCHVIHAFNRIGPRMRVTFDVLNWLLADDPDALEGRIMLLWSKAAKGDYGIVPGPPTFRVAGAYRISRVVKSGIGAKYSWEIFPHPGQWCRIQELSMNPPPFSDTANSLCKVIEPESLRAFMRRAEDRLAENSEVISQEVDRESIATFLRQVPAWQEELARRGRPAYSQGLNRPFDGLENLVPRAPSQPARTPPLPSRPKSESNLPLISKPAAVAATPPTQTEQAAPTAVETSTPPPVVVEPAPPAPPPTRADGFVESGALQETLARKYGTGIVKALLSAAVSRKIIVLRGLPGAGKSHVARHLLEDPGMDRTFIQPVAATWRGAEDLLGYVNPIDRRFQATPFTEFLIEAARAWDSGDQRHRVVIFEEFNLSQPEYWLTDILVRLEYPTSDRKARTLPLSPASKDATAISVFLSPALRFVATLNNDHTTRPLSPRVLDRAAVIELRIAPEAALDSHGVTLGTDELEAVRDLNFALRLKGISFSHRTAASLKACLDRCGTGEPRWPYLDSVLAMEVMSKVRLLTSNPADETVLDELEKWAEEHAPNLPECVRMVRGWRELLDAGQDIVQA